AVPRARRAQPARPGRSAGPRPRHQGGARMSPLPYGAVCTWWDSIDKAGQLVTDPARVTRGNGSTTTIRASTLPCCPHCRGVLFQVDSEAAWWSVINEHARRTGDADYPEFIRWLRGRCFPDMRTARAAF